MNKNSLFFWWTVLFSFPLYGSERPPQEKARSEQFFMAEFGPQSSLLAGQLSLQGAVSRVGWSLSSGLDLLSISIINRRMSELAAKSHLEGGPYRLEQQLLGVAWEKMSGNWLAGMGLEGGRAKHYQEMFQSERYLAAGVFFEIGRLLFKSPYFNIRTKWVTNYIKSGEPFDHDLGGHRRMAGFSWVLSLGLNQSLRFETDRNSGDHADIGDIP